MTRTVPRQRVVILAALIALLSAVFAYFAPDARADVTGGCWGTADFTADTVGAYSPANDTKDNPIIVPKADGNVAKWTGMAPGPNTNFSGSVSIVIGPFAIEVADWGFPNFDGTNESMGTEDSGDYNMDEFWSAVEDAGFSKSWIQGIYQATGQHTADGVNCEGDFMVKFEGNAWESPLVIVSVALLVIFFFLLIYAGRRKKRDGGFFKGRPLLALVAAIFMAITIAVILQQFCVEPLTNTTVILLPIAMIIIALFIAKFAPFGGPSIPGGTEGGGVPPIPGMTPPDDGHQAGCDWALYVKTAAGEEVVKAAQGHECCKYVVGVSTNLTRNDVVAWRRPDAPERDAIHEGGANIAGLDIDTESGVRSWPHGEQGAMHGLGDQSTWPTVGPTPGPWEEYQQVYPFEERPDAALSIRIDQQTDVWATFTDGCGRSNNVYESEIEGEADAWGTAECTNENHLPTCPVELQASALAQMKAEGDHTLVVNAMSLTDTDEIPPKIVAAGPNEEFRRAEQDGHRHDANRERDTWEVADTGSHANVVNGDHYSTSIINKIESDAGVIVPEAMRPTTDRVSAVIDAGVDSKLEVTGEATPGHAPTSTCCPDGGAQCRCRPTFSLVVGPGNQAKLTVEGNVVNLTNPNSSAVGTPQDWTRS